jgi:hypothetical protein
MLVILEGRQMELPKSVGEFRQKNFTAGFEHAMEQTLSQFGVVE